MTALNGYKTYIVAALGVVYAISGYFTGHVDANAAMEIIITSLAAAGIRHGMSTPQE